jgi:hypothetical protein
MASTGSVTARDSDGYGYAGGGDGGSRSASAAAAPRPRAWRRLLPLHCGPGRRRQRPARRRRLPPCATRLRPSRRAVWVGCGPADGLAAAVEGSCAAAGQAGGHLKSAKGGCSFDDRQKMM